MARKSTWHRLMESTEGPTVTVQIPRMWAEELLRSLATALEMDDGMGAGDEMGGDMDMGGEPHMEPDADDMGGPPDFDLDDMFGGGDEAGGEEKPEPPAGDSDDDDDSESDDDDDDEEDDDDDDEEEQDEAADYSKSGGNPSGLRTQTAFGEMFRRGGKKLSESKRRPAPRAKRR